MQSSVFVTCEPDCRVSLIYLTIRSIPRLRENLRAGFDNVSIRCPSAEEFQATDQDIINLAAYGHDAQQEPFECDYIIRLHP